MRIFVTSTPDELAPHRAAARQVLRDLGHEDVVRNDTLDVGGSAAVAACTRQVAETDAVLAVVGWRRDKVPVPEVGGDGLHSWAYWEVRGAREHSKSVTALLAVDGWRRDLSEDDADPVAAIHDLRGTLSRVAVPFDEEGGSLERFCTLVRDQIEGLGRRLEGGAVLLRCFSPPPWPPRPYPVLLPYDHPDFLAGREDEIRHLRRLLGEPDVQATAGGEARAWPRFPPAPIIGLHAPSGSGKSSLLKAGLVPSLRAAGRPCAFERCPAEPGLAGRLLRDLIEGWDGDEEARHFVGRLAAVRRMAERPPVLILDQFEDLFRRREDRRARLLVAKLLAASVQSLPGLEGPVCHWLLAYSHEFHGSVVRWLSDVFRDARRNVNALPDVTGLPHDLSGADRFRSWALPLVATPPAGCTDPAAEAAQVFLDAIERPLAFRGSGGQQIYPWRFVGDSAERLARAFGEARVRRPNASLVPELQVVLAHLLDKAGESVNGKVIDVEVPKDPGGLIDKALEGHLRHALARIFPDYRGSTRLILRTRALLVLRELANADGRRNEGASLEILARAIGPEEGESVLEELQTARTRLVVAKEHAGGWTYVLSHDRLAEVIVRLTDDGGVYADLGIDAKLLALRRFVALQSQLFAAGDTEQALEVTPEQARNIEKHAAVLLWGDERRQWWETCRARLSLVRKRRWLRWGILALLAVLTVALTVLRAPWLFRQLTLHGHLRKTPELAFAAAVELADNGIPLRFIQRQLLERDKPFDVLELGIGGVAAGRRGRAVLSVVELMEPWVKDEPVHIASAVWALDFASAEDQALADQAPALRELLLAALRQSRPPPAIPPQDRDWVDVPAGKVKLGSPDGEGYGDERPQHEVIMAPFRILRHEVTNGEYSLLFPDHDAGKAEDLPVAGVSWYEAYTYAAWLGGRLPTEAEWEYAARAGCQHDYCREDGSVTTVIDVAWTALNTDFPRPVMSLTANPWGLYDMLGNLWEWTAVWYGDYPYTDFQDPWGQLGGVSRVMRGGSFLDSADSARVAFRLRNSSDVMDEVRGFRVVLPAARIVNP